MSFTIRMPEPTILQSRSRTGIAPSITFLLLQRILLNSCLTLVTWGFAQIHPPIFAQSTPAASPSSTLSLTQLTQWGSKNPTIALPLFSSVGLALFYLMILWRSPRSLLHLPSKLTIPGSKIELPNGALLWLKYRPRVLDAWVRDHLPQLQTQFSQQPTVSDRALHIPIQIKLDTQLKDPFTAADLRPLFNQPNQIPTCLLIVGEGGVGKTSLACQIAQWGMAPVAAAKQSPALCDRPLLPVLIEQELGDTPLLTAIRNQLPRTPEGNFISDELLEALLKQRRILLILDHVSEMSDKTYIQMKQALEKTSINALILTTRLPDKHLGRVQHTRLEPQKIEGKNLSNFIQPYLEQRDKRNLFEDDAEFYRTCTRLSMMMAATLQTATALLVKLYIEQVIDAGGLKTAQLPDNIPDLMLSYLSWLNREEAVDASLRKDDILIRRDAKALAWECLKQNYRPSSISDEQALTVLSTLSTIPDPTAATTHADARTRLDYLDKRLRLVQVAAGKVRIILDPVAEYLAAFQLVECCQQADPEQRPAIWQEFFQSVDTQPDRASIRGFLLAVRNCCEQKHLPADILTELNDRANLNPEELEQVRRRQRVNKLIDDLYDTDERYLGQAITNLRQEGHYATRAIPDLEKLVKASQGLPSIRVDALNALLAIQPDRPALGNLCQTLLSDRTHAAEVRVAAVTGLMQAIYDRAALIAQLTRYLEDDTEIGVVRVQAGEGLRKLGVLSELLVVQIDQTNAHHIQRVPPPPTWVLELDPETEVTENQETAQRISLTLVKIPGGSFWMGSPPGEGSDNEKPQHRVTVPEFWMGQMAVTQAQYQAVMGRNPATFRGANRPVETVSWVDAVEFCQRMSQQVGQEVRLPSEAEWEYACRSLPSPQIPLPEGEEGIYTPFHYGATITTDLANYRGTDYEYGGQLISGSYGAGSKGIYREQTTEVGSFPPNAFGLYDLHGNVWEWCLDHWHDSYEGAPMDGSAWLTEPETANRLLRGGAWSNPPQKCRSAYRNNNAPGYHSNNLGFRVVCLAAKTLA